MAETAQLLDQADEELLSSVFAGEAEWSAPTAVERYRYKKQSGSSDGRTTADEFE